jgi:choline-sulfatase
MITQRPNILLLLSDEHSYRCFGYLDRDEGEPVDTPNLDRLAEQSVSFHQTYCQAPLCTPSRICLLTGRSPMGSGGWDNDSMIRPGVATLPESLAQAGYETCLVGKMHLGGNRQFAGFRRRPYGDLSGRTGHQWEQPFAPYQPIRDRTAKAGITAIPESKLQEQVVARETLAFLREQSDARPQQPWFVCASFSRPHFPLTAPRRYVDRYWPQWVTKPKVGRTGDTANHPMTIGMAAGFLVDQIGEDEMMRARAAYFACVSYLDEVIGDLLALLERDGLLENTIVVYTSDHGELAGEHGLWWKNSWHEAAARVPWLVQLPAHRSGELAPARIQTPVSLADLFPTLCGLSGVSAPDDLEGMDLSEAIYRGAEPPRGPVFFDNPTPRWGTGSEHRALRLGKYKYVRFRGMEPDLLFDLERDPWEQRNLIVRGTEQTAATAHELRALVDASWDFDHAEAQRCLDAEEAKRHTLPVDTRWGNLYLLPDGRLVAADSPLYEPVVIAEKPGELFADWPEGSA